MVHDSTPMRSIAESLKFAEQLLAQSGIVEPRREAISLLTFATKKDKTFIYAHGEYVLAEDELRLFDASLDRRSNREPLQYITGVQEFYGLEFEVNRDVLIPRPETEMIVEQALVIMAEPRARRFCEVGTGSGCIAVSILHSVKDAEAIGLDLSRAALDVTRRNAVKHGVSERLSLTESDIFDAVSGEKFGLIVSNPPYVPVRDFDGLQTEVRDFEPRLALTDGEDGLSIIRRIVEQSPRFLDSRGTLLIEIGFDQSGRVAGMFDPTIWKQVDFLDDLQGIPRLVCASLK